MPGIAILALGVSAFDFYFNRLAALADSTSLTPFLWDLSGIVGGAGLVKVGTLVQLKWAKLQVSRIPIQRLVLALSLMLVGFIFIIIELATDSLVCVRSTTAGFTRFLPLKHCLQYGYAHQFLWLGFLGSGMVLLGVIVSTLEEKGNSTCSTEGLTGYCRRSGMINYLLYHDATVGPVVEPGPRRGPSELAPDYELGLRS